MILRRAIISLIFFFFNDTATTEIYTLSLHDALPIFTSSSKTSKQEYRTFARFNKKSPYTSADRLSIFCFEKSALDRKSTRLNSSHANISYAVFCLKKKKKTNVFH